MKKLMVATMFVCMAGIHSASAQTKEASPKKDAIIGGAAGAATGLLVSKHKGTGALVGGAVGAGGGYLYGKHRQKHHLKK